MVLSRRIAYGVHMKRLTIIFSLFFFIISCVACSKSDETHIAGGGSSFAYPVLSLWARDYSNQSGIDINYDPIGSVAGLKQLLTRKIDFAASDIPLTSADLKQHQLIQFPIVIGGIVPIVNIPGISPNQLILDGSLLADIYQGTITYWDDARIKKINPTLALPHHLINVVHRADPSGTTFNFSHYLAQNSERWNKILSSNSIIDWPVGIAATGNDGLASHVMETPDSIGYIEFSYAIQHSLTPVRLMNAEGMAITANFATVEQAAVHANWSKEHGFYVAWTNPHTQNTWPIVATTYLLLPQKPRNAIIRQELVAFLNWCFTQGETHAQELGYVAVPADVYPSILASLT